MWAAWLTVPINLLLRRAASHCKLILQFQPPSPAIGPLTGIWNYHFNQLESDLILPFWYKKKWYTTGPCTNRSSLNVGLERKVAAYFCSYQNILVPSAAVSLLLRIYMHYCGKRLKRLLNPEDKGMNYKYKPLFVFIQTTGLPCFKDWRLIHRWVSICVISTQI